MAAMARLFKDHKAEAVPRFEGQSMHDARTRVLDVVRDSSVELLLGMREPGSVRVRWVER